MGGSQTGGGEEENNRAQKTKQAITAKARKDHGQFSHGALCLLDRVLGEEREGPERMVSDFPNCLT